MRRGMQRREGVANFLASPLVGEVGGGPTASAGEENLVLASSADADAAPPPCPPHEGEGLGRFAAVAGSALALAGCAATQASDAVAPTAPGFLLGLWHGFIFPVAWVVSLFVPSVAVYAVPNNGGWYDFGYFLGIVVFGVGARKTQVVTRDVYRGGRVVDSTARRID